MIKAVSSIDNAINAIINKSSASPIEVITKKDPKSFANPRSKRFIEFCQGYSQGLVLPNDYERWTVRIADDNVSIDKQPMLDLIKYLRGFNVDRNNPDPLRTAFEDAENPLLKDRILGTLNKYQGDWLSYLAYRFEDWTEYNGRPTLVIASSETASLLEHFAGKDLLHYV